MKEIRPIVLFVDDEELARRTFKRMVDKEFRVLLAGDVKEAIEVLEEHHEEIGVLLSDQRMPGQLGVDLLEHCRREYPDIIRMLTTAYSELNDAIAAVNRGEIMRYIEKPWGNIDGILIDLKLAATLYEIKKENQQLIDEKLSVGFKTSQMDKIRSLITVAASQGSDQALTAVESMLRQIADVEACYKSPDIIELRNYQMFGQPLENTISAIELGKELSHKTKAPKMDLAALEAGCSDISANDLAVIVADAETILENAEIQSSKEEDGCLLTVNGSNSSDCIREWLGSYEFSKANNQNLASLLRLFINTHELGGSVELSIDDEGLLNSFNIYCSGKAQEPLGQGQGYYDWIDDLMILFS